MEVMWRAFAESPALEQFRLLKEHAARRALFASCICSQCDGIEDTSTDARPSDLAASIAI
jgi:hypothetical protein